MSLRNWLRAFFLVLGVAILGALAAATWVQQWLQSPLTVPAEGVEYTLKPGSSIGQAAYDLRDLHSLDKPRWLALYARFAERTAVKAGEYLIPAGTTPLGFLDILERGDVIVRSVTLVEGWTFRQALAHLHTQEKVEPLLKGLSEIEQLTKIGLQDTHPEGWFFPETYAYTAGTSDLALLRQAHQHMQKVLDEEWAQRAKNLPYKSAYEALIMASIVERETGQPSEREQIAGVFVRRLQKKMRLQTDPTVIYGLGPDFDGNIRRHHLSQQTPYNTYRIKGLPPTPIALPGREAIHAALHPDSGSALYFVAQGDGSHYFSDTLAEHNRAVRKYQITRRAKQYRSSPAPSNNNKN